MVFVKKSVETRCTLLMTLLPSLTTLGMDEKFESNKTRCDTFLAASEPDAIAIDVSASFKARISLTPSPVMATVRPLFFKDSIKSFFCWGETRPKTVYLEADLTTSLSCMPSKLIYLSAFAMPARWEILDTVAGLSPEITLTSTLCDLKYSIVSIASGRIVSSIMIKAKGSTLPKIWLFVISAFVYATTSTR